MCLLAFAINAHPQYPFVFAGNRDEFHARETAAAHWWDEATDVFGGRDLEAGGAWLGMQRDGYFAVLTNFRDPDQKKPGAPSRGELVREFLAGPLDMNDMHEWLLRDGASYAGFNIIYGRLGSEPQLYWYSNAGGPEQPLLLEEGIHGLSNHLLDTPWPKVQRTTQGLDNVLHNDDVEHDMLQDLLDDPRPAADAHLPDTGIPTEWERLLSAPKIISSEYGTRASTTLLLDRQGNASFVERSFDMAGREQDRREARFRVPDASVNMGE
ncbi:MAG: NRDE family protein [Gammaproteobacteria bacterium]|nr:NRDE family protein [Gammaproteobacteria bacterium]